MTTVLIATSPEEIRNLLPWAILLAESRDGELTVFLAQRRKGETRLNDLPVVAASDESEMVSLARKTLQELDCPPFGAVEAPVEVDLPTDTEVPSETLEADKSQGEPVSTVEFPDVSIQPKLLQLVGEHWTDGLSGFVQELSPKLVIVPAPSISKEQNAQDDWQTSLQEDIDCDVILMRDDAVAVTGQFAVAVFIQDRADNETALSYSAGLVEKFGGRATAVYIEPAVGDDAESVGRRRVDYQLRRLLSPRLLPLFTPHVIVASNPADAFQQIDASVFDLLIFGTRDLRAMRKFLQATPNTSGEEESTIPAVAVVSRGDSFSNRILNKADRWVRSIVPQLSREERIKLVSRIQTNSQWDFDFVCLISLATLIACLGLAENSGAVIVGAMLVAPLMTPIAGVGLGVAHANAYLTRTAFRTALRGFATAILIGVIFGIAVQGSAHFKWLSPLDTSDAGTIQSTFPQEMEARTRPQFYDLLIALASGIAAAYAMGRPNLYSALPGVAIAAALVPPIATSGIALAHGDITKGGGALLLFVTNMVTIILGTSLVFRAVGVRSQKEGPNAAKWPRYTLLLLVLLSVMITMVIEFKT